MKPECGKRLCESMVIISTLLFLVLQWGSLQPVTSVASDQLESYIIRLDPSRRPSPFPTHESWHQAILDSATSSSVSSSSSSTSGKLLYSYKHALHGFSARLNPWELRKIEKLRAHRATFRERYGKLSTTSSPEYLGLKHKSGLWPASSFGRDIIIGVLDTGIWPESKSFTDQGYTTIPKHWKGECETGASFNKSMCNLKLIGARSFSNGFKAHTKTNISKENDYDSARDFDGHGTHVASVAVGSSVPDTSHFGYSRGTAEGVAPSARLSMYKVAWFKTVVYSDVLAGIDKAIADGVDILSISLEFDFNPYYDDSLAIGALSAVKKGIFVVCSAGNDGRVKSIHNGAPWIMTVSASTTRRSLTAEMSLGKRGDLKLKGTSYYPPSIGLKISNVPLYYGKNERAKAQCLPSSLEPAQVRGKVLLCDLMNNQPADIYGAIDEVNRTRAKASIFLMNGTYGKYNLKPTDYHLPIVVISNNEGANKVLQYAREDREATVMKLIFGFTDDGGTHQPSPQVASFSSRGPDPVTPSVLKPDILAPGKDIIGAWVPNKPFVTIDGKEFKTDYAVSSGTSVATPHIAGVAALLKSVHRKWSPAAIRSAIMTTATHVDDNAKPITVEGLTSAGTPLDFGAGLVNPNAAVNPGLIYDMDYKDYDEFLCTLKYTKQQMEDVIRNSTNRWSSKSKSVYDLNYPSFMAIFTNARNESKLSKTFSRVVTNVGDDKAKYASFVAADPGMTIQAHPTSLNFSQKYMRLGFTLTVELNIKAWNSSLYPVPNGFLHWVDHSGNHTVSSPVVAMIV
ncbi:hypothetical protein H6P81_011037 [Aristolochia fimbriata]|uniref:Uncharacterized protein n=1 Tax=Aristolochia fimbriata TaxID=158543 RepID=A0AAV7EQE4_ARIFI|nr:hypothetical protein H6P81_011037 [Aristolochia fimbriata]